MNWNITFESLSLFLDNYTLALFALALLSYTWAVKKLTAFNLTIFLAMLLQLLHYFMEWSLEPLFNNPDYVWEVFFAWYSMYAITDIVFVFTCLSLTEHFGLQRDRASKFILKCYLAMAAIQLSVMIAILMGIPGAALLYKTSIIGINLAVNSLSLILAMRVILVRYNLVNMNMLGGKA